jgi:hypothetical protein
MNLLNYTLHSAESRRHTAIRRRWADPTAIRQWHKPSDPIQAARIEAAVAKRARRAAKLESDMWMATRYNETNKDGRGSILRALNPTYVAK